MKIKDRITKKRNRQTIRRRKTKENVTMKRGKSEAKIKSKRSG